MPIYRIRKYSGCEGGSNYYHHADVIASRPRSALVAAQEGRVRNWRWIDRFDTSSVDYEQFEFLQNVPWSEARNPKPPKSRKFMFLERKIMKIEGVCFANVFDGQAFIGIRRRSPKIFREVRSLVNNSTGNYVKVNYRIL